MRAIEKRLRLIEGRMGSRGGNYVVTIPKDHDWDYGDHDDRVIAEAIAAHQEATGYYGPVVIMPEMLTIEEWTERSARLRLADGSGP